MFKAGPTGSIVAEAKAFMYLKQFYEGAATLPYNRCWNRRTKGLQDNSVPLIVRDEDEEDEEWKLVEDNEEEDESDLYTQLDYIQDTENEDMEERADQETFWYHYQRGNKPLEKISVELGISLIEGELTMLRKNMGEMNDTMLTLFSQPGQLLLLQRQLRVGLQLPL